MLASAGEAMPSCRQSDAWPGMSNTLVFLNAALSMGFPITPAAHVARRCANFAFDGFLNALSRPFLDLRA